MGKSNFCCNCWALYFFFPWNQALEQDSWSRVIQSFFLKNKYRENAQKVNDLNGCPFFFYLTLTSKMKTLRAWFNSIIKSYNNNLKISVDLKFFPVPGTKFHKSFHYIFLLEMLRKVSTFKRVPILLLKERNSQPLILSDVGNFSSQEESLKLKALLSTKQYSQPSTLMLKDKSVLFCKSDSKHILQFYLWTSTSPLWKIFHLYLFLHSFCQPQNCH